MKRLENYLIWFTLLGGSFSSLEAESAPDTKAALPVDAKVPDAKALGYLRTYGYAVALNSGVVNLNLEGEERNVFIKGIDEFFKGESVPDDIELADMEAFVAEIEKARIEKRKIDGKKFLDGKAKEPGFFRKDGLVYKIVVPGSTVHPTETSSVEVSYVAKCNGKEFDAGDHIVLFLDNTMLGFSQATQIIGEGGQIHVYIESALGFGDTSSGQISGGSVLEFLITLHKVLPLETPESTATTATPAPAATPAAAPAAPAATPATTK
jgi:FKBP-type peptidyl-prolyl cis-trans isomerase